MGPPAIHPGEILTEEIEYLGMSAVDLACVLGMSVDQITRILQGGRPVTAETALRLSQWLGTSAQVWMNLQATYELREAEQAIGDEIRRTVIRRDAA